MVVFVFVFLFFSFLLLSVGFVVVLWVWLKWVVGHDIVGCELLRLVIGLVEINVGEVMARSWRWILGFGFCMVALVLLGSTVFFFFFLLLWS